MLHGDVLGERARLTPEKTALVFVPTGERITYGALDERASRCASMWREQLGLAKGDRIGLLANNRVDFLDCFFAAGRRAAPSSCRWARVSPQTRWHTSCSTAGCAPSSTTAPLPRSSASSSGWSNSSVGSPSTNPSTQTICDTLISFPGPRTPDPGPLSRRRTRTVSCTRPAPQGNPRV